MLVDTSSWLSLTQHEISINKSQVVLILLRFARQIDNSTTKPMANTETQNNRNSKQNSSKETICPG